MKREYFVSWICDNDKGTAYGNAVYTITGRISGKTLDKLEKHIEKEHKLENVVLLHFIKL